jgi:hypothetical protein
MIAFCDCPFDPLAPRSAIYRRHEQTSAARSHARRNRNMVLS